MKLRWFTLAAASFATLAVAAPSRGLVGSILPDRSKNIAGWEIETRQSSCVVDSFNAACTMARLRRGRSIVVALTKRTELGGTREERITKAFYIKMPQGATSADCREIDGHPAVAGWLWPKSKFAIIFTTDGRVLRKSVVKYVVDAPCEVGQS